MDWFQIILGSLISTTSVVTVVAFLARESFAILLDRKHELYKHQLELDTSKHELALEAQIAFKEKQLSEFYGPIYALLKRGRTIYKYVMDGKLGDIDEHLRKMAVEANNAIVNIILTKSHLIEGSVIPNSYIHFLTHVEIWHAYLKTEFQGVPYSQSEFPEAYYPVEFEKDIYLTTEALKFELQGLYRQYGITQQGDKLKN